LVGEGGGFGRVRKKQGRRRRQLTVDDRGRDSSKREGGSQSGGDTSVEEAREVHCEDRRMKVREQLSKPGRRGRRWCSKLNPSASGLIGLITNPRPRNRAPARRPVSTPPRPRFPTGAQVLCRAATTPPAYLTNRPPGQAHTSKRTQLQNTPCKSKANRI